MKTPIVKTLVAASLTLSSLCLFAAPLSILESVACSGDASGFSESPCFVLPGVTSFVIQGDLTPEGSNAFDLSDFFKISGLLAGAGYDYGFSQTGTSAFGLFFDSDSVLEVFDSTTPTGSVLADAGGNIFAGFFLEDGATDPSTYSLTINAVPTPTSAALLGMGLLLGMTGARKSKPTVAS
jgi:hypothetical protein